ncbi:MAG: BtpA/SgcQ family protein [Vicinamibacterales bacterium]
MLFTDIFSTPVPIIGVIHLPALPGYDQSPGLDAVLAHALADLHAFMAGGVDAVLVENEGDRPHRVKAEPETIACMTRIGHAVAREAGGLPVGVEILLNDPRASLAVAHAVGARFIRTDYFVDRMERPEHGGEMAIDPAGLLAYRETLGADGVLILADIQVKHARMIEPRPLSVSATLAEQHGADAVIVTGDLTGLAPSPADVEEARRGAASIPVLVGSGLDDTNAGQLLGAADGAIVGTFVRPGIAVDPERLRRLMEGVRAARASRRG